MKLIRTLLAGEGEGVCSGVGEGGTDCSGEIDGEGDSPGVADKGTTNLTDSFPKWSPFTFRLDEEHTLLWLTVSSIRQYGLRPPPSNSSSESASGTLIWMVGFDPQALSNGLDPSFAAFALPFQDITTSNHIAQWTQEVVGIIP